MNPSSSHSGSLWTIWPLNIVKRQLRNSGIWTGGTSLRNPITLRRLRIGLLPAAFPESIFSKRDLYLVNFNQVILQFINFVICFLHTILIQNNEFQNLLFIRDQFLLKLPNFIAYVPFHKIFKIRKVVVVSLIVSRACKYDRFKWVLLTIKLENLLNNEIQLLLFLEQQARSHALNALIGHTYFRNQEVQ